MPACKNLLTHGCKILRIYCHISCRFKGACRASHGAKTHAYISTDPGTTGSLRRASSSMVPSGVPPEGHTMVLFPFSLTCLLLLLAHLGLPIIIPRLWYCQGKFVPYLLCLLWHLHKCHMAVLLAETMLHGPSLTLFALCSVGQRSALHEKNPTSVVCQLV